MVLKVSLARARALSLSLLFLSLISLSLSLSHSLPKINMPNPGKCARARTGEAYCGRLCSCQDTHRLHAVFVYFQDLVHLSQKIRKFLVSLRGLARVRQGVDVRKGIFGKDQDDDFAIAHCSRNLPTRRCRLSRNWFQEYLFDVRSQSLFNIAGLRTICVFAVSDAHGITLSRHRCVK